MTTRITTDNITDGTILPADLSNLPNLVDWQSVVVADGSTGLSLEAGKGYFINTTSATQAATLPSDPNIGDTISIRDYAGTFGSNKLTIDRNGEPIEGGTTNLEYATNNFVITLVYVDGTRGWVTTESEAKTGTFTALFTEATGGTITTSGDYKIHTFTGDGCFVVSQIGNSPANPTGGPTTVSYLVIAGGGAGGSKKGGGGGAGGYREGRDITPSYTASPLVAPAGLTITATTFPVTVGGGGAGTPECSQSVNNGSNSVFSTITSAGGGGGGTPGAAHPNNPGNGAGADGGSGGGVSDMRTNVAYRGAGNVPPVSPAQGRDGGMGVDFPPSGGGGGGGAGAQGADATTPGNGPSPNNKGGNGGAGVPTNITGSGVTRAGGGGGGINPGGSGEGDGGSGGGGAGGVCGPGPSGAGSANTGGGGGGGGAGASCNSGGNGGKGIVVIRYKFQ